MTTGERCGWTDALFRQCILPPEHKGVPCAFETVHPTTGQALVPRRHAFLYQGTPVTRVWVAKQAKKLVEKGRDWAHIAKVFAVRGVTRGDGSPVTAEQMEGWVLNCRHGHPIGCRPPCGACVRGETSDEEYVGYAYLDRRDDLNRRRLR